MSKLQVLIGLCLMAILPSCVTVSEETFSPKQLTVDVAEKDSTELDWWVANNFRVIKTEKEQVRFYRDLSMYLTAYWRWSDNESSGIKIPFTNNLAEDPIQETGPIDEQGQEEERSGWFKSNERMYKTFYQPQKYTYDYSDSDSFLTRTPSQKWAIDPARLIRLNWPSYMNEICEWVLTDRSNGRIEKSTALCGTADTPNEESCNADANLEPPLPCFKVVKDRRYSVQVRHIESDTRSHKNIFVQDKLIVALGDSYSSGEGNPQAEWQWPIKPRPTLWWDARCHRSFLSGPALAAAFYAKRYPRRSITFLHYGCSGATIDDGIARSWRGLETSEQRRKTQNNKFFHMLGLGHTCDSDQAPPPIGKAKETRQGRFLNLGADGCDKTSAPSREGNPKRVSDVLPSQIAMAFHDLTHESTLPTDNPTGQETHWAIDRSPDVLIISAGGNDIGFAQLVAGISRPGDRHEDLRFAGRIDRRPHSSTDQYSASSIAVRATRLVGQIAKDLQESKDIGARPGFCPSNEDHFKRTDQKRVDTSRLAVEQIAKCILWPDGNSEELQNRAAFVINAVMRADEWLKDQYKLLSGEVGRRLSPKQTIVTRYPSTVTYRPEPQKNPLQYKPCSDRIWNAKPDLVPALFLFVANAGAGSKDIAAADMYVIPRLNGQVREAIADERQWRHVHSSFNEFTRPFGYCSREARLLNTFYLSFRTQGLVSRGFVPQGTIAKDVGDAKKFLSWDVANGCYVEFDIGAPLGDPDRPCLRQSSEDWTKGLEEVVQQLNRNSVMGRSETQESGGFPPTGTFHPTVLGHCAYALSILLEMDSDFAPELDYRTVPVDSQRTEPQWQLKTLKNFCSAERLGFQVSKK